jgi:hypothetical protein
MEHYYRPICDADDYDTKKYSGFVELQNTKVKDAILKAGLDLTHFAQWIRKGNIKNLNQVRLLPRVLPADPIPALVPPVGLRAAFHQSSLITTLSLYNKRDPSGNGATTILAEGALPLNEKYFFITRTAN